MIRRVNGNKFIDPSDVSVVWNNSYPMSRIGMAILVTIHCGLNGNAMEPDVVTVVASSRKRFLVE